MKRGFTIIEVLVIIVVISILAGMTYFFVGDWRGETATNEVKSDLTNAVNALENHRNFNASGYANSLSEVNYSGSDTVTLNYQKRSANNSYCLNATSTVKPDVAWYVDSATGKAPKPGSCTP